MQTDPQISALQYQTMGVRSQRIPRIISCCSFVSLLVFLRQIIGAGDGAAMMYRVLLYAPMREWPLQIITGWGATVLLAAGAIAVPRWRLIQAWAVLIGAILGIACITGFAMAARFPWIDLKADAFSLAVLVLLAILATFEMLNSKVSVAARSS